MVSMNTSRRDFLRTTAAAGAAFAVPCGWGADAKPIFRVGLMTDTHIGKDRKSCGLVKAAWELFKRERVDLVVNLGDIADHHYPTGYAAYRACIDETFPGGVGKPDELYVYAWHDAYDYKGSIDRGVPHYVEAFADTERLLGATNGQFCAREYAGFPFLVVPQMLRTREMREQFERMVEDACAKHPGKPVFVFDHIPPKGTTFNSATWGDQFRREFYGRHPQIVAITGHTHGSIRDENCIWQGEFTVVNCGCLQHWSGELVGTNDKSKDSYGVLVMDLYADKAVFRRFDDVRNPVEYRTDAPWTVPFPFDRATAPYAPARRRARAAAPAFAAASVLSVNPDTIPCSAIRLSWPQIPDPNPAYKYKIEVETTAAGGKRRPLVRRDVCGEFFLPEGQRAKTLVHDISAAFFEKGRRYRIVVTPVGFFGNEGKPLVSELTAPAAVDDVEKTVLDVRDPGGKYPAVTAVLGNERTEAKDGWFSNLGRLDLPKAIWEAPKGTRFRCVVDIETEAGEPDSFILGFVHPSPLQYQGRVRTPSGVPGKRRYVFEFARWDTEKFYSFYTQGGPGRVRLDRIVISRLKGKDS